MMGLCVVVSIQCNPRLSSSPSLLCRGELFFIYVREESANKNMAVCLQVVARRTVKAAQSTAVKARRLSAAPTTPTSGTSSRKQTR